MSVGNDYSSFLNIQNTFDGQFYYSFASLEAQISVCAYIKCPRQLDTNVTHIIADSRIRDR